LSPKGRQIHKRFHERVLRQILGFLSVANHMVDGREHPILILAHEHPKGVCVALEGCGD
jgi:hypothetical protein